MSDEVRTDEEKARMYAAMLGGANVITSVLDANNELPNGLDSVKSIKSAPLLKSAFCSFSES